MRVRSSVPSSRGIAPLVIVLGVAAAALVCYTLYQAYTERTAASSTYTYDSSTGAYYDDDGYAYAPSIASDTTATEQTASHQPPPRPDSAEFQAMLLERFDVDGDGVLSETEAAAAKADMEAHRPKDGMRGPQRRGDGTMGPPPDGEMGPGGDMLDRFDVDGDGTLSETEREARRAAMDALRDDPALTELFEAVKAAHEALRTAAAAGDTEAMATARTDLQAAQEAFEAKRTELLGN